MENALTLYALTSEVAAILDAEDGDLDRLNELLPAIEHKAAAVAHFAQMNDDLAAAIKERERLVVAHRKSLEAKAERARAYLKAAMEAAEIHSLTDKRTGTTIKLQANPPSVQITDETLLPDEVWRLPPAPPPEPDKKAIAERLKAGEEVPGAALVQTTRVVIR
jgi:uncharacterized protein YoxC